jgi:acyl-CoA thioester hydrolase
MFVHRERVRYRDINSFGHVSYALFLVYAEEARNAWLRQLGLLKRADDHVPIIVARSEVDYRSQVSVDDEIAIAIHCSRVGNKSFDLVYEFRVDDRLVADVRTVVVGLDYESGETIRIPDDWRAALSSGTE